jgi:hypothetical protein
MSVYISEVLKKKEKPIIKIIKDEWKCSKKTITYLHPRMRLHGCWWAVRDHFALLYDKLHEWHPYLSDTNRFEGYKHLCFNPKVVYIATDCFHILIDGCTNPKVVLCVYVNKQGRLFFRHHIPGKCPLATYKIDR